MSATALIIDDDPAYARSLARLIQREGIRVEVAHSGEDALARLTDLQLDLALVDMTLPGINGVEVLRRLKEGEPQAVCIAISAYPTVESAVAAMHAGAFDFVTKGASLEEIQFKVHKGLEVAELRRDLQFLREQHRRSQSGEMVGESPSMLRVYEQVREIAATRATTVLILGETGTGKELVARAIHQLSDRRDHPLVPLNCTAIPDQLVESELFGHERGAFTGADRAKKGLLELADRGTLFLDEIGDLDLSLQGKLLRVIEERRFRRVGGVRDIEVDVRFLAATNRALDQLAAAGRFRSDLLYRLNVFEILLPPLRERGDDVLRLAEHFIGELNAQLGKDVRGLDQGSQRLLLAHHFPGNVRQLRNLVEQAMILARGDWLTLEGSRPAGPPAAETGGGAAGPSIAAGAPSSARAPTGAPPFGAEASLATSLAELRRREDQLAQEERDIIGEALSQARGNKSHAAKLLGISRYALQRRLRRFDESVR